MRAIHGQALAAALLAIINHSNPGIAPSQMSELQLDRPSVGAAIQKRWSENKNGQTGSPS
eukprot:CAMPEP_0174302092 /NCGR_PEP_ID=MMETSP0809-20121228/59436_1 /TAXON_ID=73025 ORGANISM="Eutreptiella gymnastica-like, Strain CCMP1594" /NCGR_SAMPLE_ID=MMETSP0809 /ASSEMBLY_ACC=CAM_ASM_000658 /LENGTH=59 /DNA_ID=CAMNT_0015407963 /DNA_START=1514 /DNA_END=1694 /DNA_ORIENTATION=-